MELARTADEVNAAEVHIDADIPPATAALVLGTLAARLGPERVRLCADGSTALALTDVARCIQATIADPRVVRDRL